MPPKFTLQTVLDVRHSKVEAIEIEMGQLMQDRHQKEELLISLQSAQSHLYETLHQYMTGEIDLFTINHLRANIKQIEEGFEMVNAAIEELSIQIEQKRLALVEAKKEEESLKILKDKEYERYLEEEKEKEKRFMDDVYISQGFRAKKNEVWL